MIHSKVTTQSNQEGSAILLALIVIVVGGILITNWIKTKPELGSSHLYFDKYQARLIAEGIIHGASMSDSLLVNEGWSVSDSSSVDFFYSQRWLKVWKKDRRLGQLKSSNLEECNDEFWNSTLKLWTREELTGDTRRVEGDISVKSPEDIEDDMTENTLSFSWFQEMVSQLEQSWVSLDSAGQLESFSSDRVVSHSEKIDGVKWYIDGKLILEPGAEMRNAIILAEEGVELQNDSYLDGRVLSRGPIELGVNSKGSGWWATAVEVNRDENLKDQREKDIDEYAKIRLQGAEFSGTLMGLNGPRSLARDYWSIEKDATSDFEGFILSPFPVKIAGEVSGFVWAFSLNCGSGTNCLGNIRLNSWDENQVCIQSSWLQSSDSTDGQAMQLEWIP